MISIKSDREIELMRIAGKYLSDTFKYIEKYIKTGVTTKRLDTLIHDYILSIGCVPSCLGYEGYPATACISINDEVVHGIPSDKRVLQEGDIVSLDAGLIYEGYHSDAARTYPVGNISKEAADLIEVTRQSFFEGIKFARAGNHLHDISNAIDDYCRKRGYGVVRQLVGHGIGTHLHEDPSIPNYHQWRRGIKLCPGMTLAIEPMINIGGYEVAWADDDWTVVTMDGSLSAHYENTILITEGAPEILTLPSYHME